MVKRFLILFLIPALFSCEPQVNKPSDDEIRVATLGLFEHLQTADGGGGYRADKITVLRTRPGNDRKEYYAEVRIIGMHKAPPLANPLPDEPIDETREVRLRWTDGKWEFAPEDGH